MMRLMDLSAQSLVVFRRILKLVELATPSQLYIRAPALRYTLKARKITDLHDLMLFGLRKFDKKSTSYCGIVLMP